MADVEVRPVADPSELAGWARADAVTFLEDADADDFPESVRIRERAFVPGRYRGAWADGRCVGTLATLERVLTVPGSNGTTRDLTADAVTSVSVAATHRRQGLLRRMITDSLHAAHERGDAVSILYAAEWPIYGRHGYSPATQVARYTLFPRRGGTPAAADTGRIRQVERADLPEIARTVFDAARRRRPGQIDRPGAWWDRLLGQDGYQLPRHGHLNWLVHDGDDGPDGLIGWRGTRDFDMYDRFAALSAPEIVAANDGAYRDLWAYLGSIDAVEEIDLPNRAVDEPVRWLLPNGRALRCVEYGDAVWLRLLDVPAALATRSYAVAGDVVLDVVDDSTGGFASGRFRLAAGDDGAATCDTTTDAADVRLSQHALASAYLGGFSLRARAVVDDVEQLTPGAVARLDAMLHSSVTPWTQTNF